MIFHETSLRGSYVLEMEKVEDERGFFARTWCNEELEAQNLDTNLAQCSLSFNRYKGTLRGMHFQVPPHAETKLVWCTKGAIFDVIVDIRAHSNTYLSWVGVELTEENLKMVYIPKGFAHGFQTLVDNSEVFYFVSDAYCPEAGRGMHWDDPAIQISWPQVETRVISERDQNWPMFIPGQSLWFE